jgi:HK97 family phage prohead protease
MSIKAKSFGIKAMDEQSEYQFEGYGSTFGTVDRQGDIIEKGAFDKTLRSKSVLPLLFNHDRNSVIGKLETSIDANGLLVKGYLNLKDPKAQNVYELMKMGALDSLSIGFAVKDHEPVDNSRPFGAWRIKEAELYEISIVTVPANDKALISNVKSFDQDENWFNEMVKKAIHEALLEEKAIDNKKNSLLDQIKAIENSVGLLDENINLVFDQIKEEDK